MWDRDRQAPISALKGNLIGMSGPKDRHGGADRAADGMVQ